MIFFVDLILAVAFIVAITGCGAVCKSAINIRGALYKAVKRKKNFSGPFQLSCEGLFL